MNDPGSRRPIAQTRTSPRDNASWSQNDGQQRLDRRAAAPAYNRPDVSRLLAGESLQSVCIFFTGRENCFSNYNAQALT